jgi:hypothetical protein
MGREEENRWPWRGQAALARPTPQRVSGAALGGPLGAVYFPSGTKGQQPLVFPALAGLRGRAAAPANSVARERLCVCHVAHPTRGSSPAWAETPARGLGRRAERVDRAVPDRAAPHACLATQSQIADTKPVG